jgi:hypothetical protein
VQATPNVLEQNEKTEKLDGSNAGKERKRIAQG